MQRKQFESGLGFSGENSRVKEAQSKNKNSLRRCLLFDFTIVSPRTPPMPTNKYSSGN